MSCARRFHFCFQNSFCAHRDVIYRDDIDPFVKLVDDGVFFAEPDLSYCVVDKLQYRSITSSFKFS